MRKFLKTFSTWQQLDEYLNKIDVLPMFISFASKNGLTQNSQEINKSKELLTAHLKAYIIRNIFDDKGFYPVALSIDKVYKSAINYLEKN